MSEDASGMIRVALVEDNSTIRQGLAALIDGTPGFSCTGSFGDCESLLAGLPGFEADVLLMDIGLPGISGIEGVRRLQRERPGLAVLILTIYEENDLVFDALCAGACGYLVKKTPPARLLEAIQEAHEGGSPMSSHIARKVVTLLRRTGSAPPFMASPVDGFHAPVPDAEETLLTPREREILTGLADGNSYQAIARSLHISTDTVRFHIRNIYRKLHVHSQSEAVAKALRRGIL
ncbi:MAG TPA: response regulator transcription factor [Thermoanaerobaculia bacterium]|nr:response regulator transcription factor [Thermoanaerobaculia bacterium]